MPRRIDIELTSAREDGSWTWRAAGAREPKGTIDSGILPADASTGQVLRVEVEGHLDGIEVVNVLPPKAPRSEPERLELRSTATEQPLVTSTLAPRRSGERGERGERGRRRNERGRDERPRDGGGTRTRERRGERGDRGPDRGDRRHDRPSRPAPPPVDEKAKPKRLRPGKAHRSTLLESVPAEQRPIAEQLLAGGIPAVRQAIEKQNAELKAEGKSEVKPDALLRVAEDLRPRAAAAVWRDRAEAATAIVDELDLRDLRSVVNAAGDAGRDEEARALAAQLREALANRVEKEHAAWLAELGDTVRAGRVVRALRLSSRPPKAGAPIPGDVATQLAEATAASLTAETGPDRWATVLDALAYSPVRRRVIPQSLPEKLSPDLRTTIARLASRLPEIAHIFDIEPDPAAERAARGARRRPGGGERPRGGKGGTGDRPRGGKGGTRARGGSAPKDAKPRKGEKGGNDEAATRADAPGAPEAPEAPAAPEAKADATTRPGEQAATEAPATETPASEAAEATANDAPEASAAEVTATEAPASEAPEAPETKADATTTPGEPAAATEAPDSEAAEPAVSDATEPSAAEVTASEAPAEPSATEAPASEAPTEPSSTEAPASETAEAPASEAAEAPPSEAAEPSATEAPASEAPAEVAASEASANDATPEGSRSEASADAPTTEATSAAPDAAPSSSPASS